tara:strand:+ start:15961 stop:19587 length:3627 start_codon:yes stop_codon:yes gene_type:complete
MLRPTKNELEDPFSYDLDDELGLNTPEGPESYPLDLPEEPTLDAWDYAKDMAMAPLRGVSEAGRSLVSLADAVTGDDLIPDEAHDRDKGIWMGRSETVVGSAIEGVSNFALGFVPFMGALSKVGKAHQAFKLGSAAKGAVAGGLTDLTVFQGLEGRLSDMIEEDGRLSNPISEFLASDADDTEIEGRLKNALEGLMLGGAIDGIITGVKAIKAGRKATEAGSDVNQAVAEVVGEGDDLAKVTAEVEAYNTQAITEAPENQRPTPLRPVDDLQAKQEANQADLEDIAGKGEEIDALVKGEAKESVDTVGKSIDDQVTAQDRIAIKGMARNPDITNVANFNADAFSSNADVQMYLDLRTKHMVNEDLKAGNGVRPKPETLKVTAQKSIKALEDIMGEDLSFHAQMEMHKMNAKQIHAYTHQLGALEVQITNASKTILEESKLFAQSKNPMHKVNAKRAIQQLATMQQMAGGYKYAQGHALQANRYNRYMKQYSKEDAVRMTKELEESDGANFDKLLEDIASAKDGAPLGKMVNDRLKNGKWTRVHNEFWLNSILSGAKTHVVQLASNSANSLFLPAEGWLGAMARGDRAASQAMAKQYTFMMESVGSAFHFAKQAWKKGEGILDSNPAFEGVNTRNISAENFDLDVDTTLGKLAEISGNVVRAPTRLLMSTDEFFKQLNYRAAAKSKFYELGTREGLSGKELDNYITKKFAEVVDVSGKKYSEKNIQTKGEALGRSQGLTGVDLGRFVAKHVKENFDPTNSELKDLYEASEYGSMVASEATFTTSLDKEGNVLEQASVALQQFGNKQPLMKLMVPFVTTPVNLVKFVGQRTLPMGKTPVLGEIHNRYIKDLASDDPLVVAKAKGRVATGTMMWTTAATLAGSGVITGGGPDDFAEKKILEGTGWQPWSLKIGDTYISYNRTEPFGTFLGLVAGFTERLRRGVPHEDEGMNHYAMSAILAFSDNITDRTYMSGLSDVLGAISDPKEGGEALIRNRFASYIPSLANSLKADTAMREVRDISDALINRVPFASKGLDPRRNILGEVVEAKMFGEPINSIGNPLTLSRDKGDAVFNELAELHHGFGNPSPILDSAVDLTEYENPNTGYTAYDRYQELTGQVKLSGKTLHQSLKKLVKSKQYRQLISTKEFEDLDDIGSNPRVREINRLISSYRREARRKLTREFPEIRNALKNTGRVKEALRSGRDVQAFIDAT